MIKLIKLPLIAKEIFQQVYREIRLLSSEKLKLGQKQ